MEVEIIRRNGFLQPPQGEAPLDQVFQLPNISWPWVTPSSNPVRRGYKSRKNRGGLRIPLVNDTLPVDHDDGITRFLDSVGLLISFPIDAAA